jgi:hypothetical protein
MINLQRAVNTLEALQIGLTNAITQVTKAIDAADNVNATELSGALDIVNRNLKTLDPFSVPLESLRALLKQYGRTIEEVSAKTKAAKLVAALTNVVLDKADRELAVKNIAEALAAMEKVDVAK